MSPPKTKALRPRPSSAKCATVDQQVDDLVDTILLSSRALVALSARSIATAHGVTLPQFRMFVVLEAHQTNLRGLAAALDVAPSTATRMVLAATAGFGGVAVPMSWPASPGSLPDRRMGFRGNFPDQWLD